MKEERKTIVHKKDGEEDSGEDEDKYKRYKKEEERDYSGNEKKYKKYNDDEEDDRKYSKYDRRGGDRDEDKYGKRMGDSSASEALLSMAGLQSMPSANSQLQLSSGGTMNNGLTLATIFGAHSQSSEEKAKSS